MRLIAARWRLSTRRYRNRWTHFWEWGPVRRVRHWQWVNYRDGKFPFRRFWTLPKTPSCWARSLGRCYYWCRSPSSLGKGPGRGISLNRASPVGEETARCGARSPHLAQESITVITPTPPQSKNGLKRKPTLSSWENSQDSPPSSASTPASFPALPSGFASSTFRAWEGRGFQLLTYLRWRNWECLSASYRLSHRRRSFGGCTCWVPFWLSSCVLRTVRRPMTL